MFYCFKSSSILKRICTHKMCVDVKEKSKINSVIRCCYYYYYQRYAAGNNKCNKYNKIQCRWRSATHILVFLDDDGTYKSFTSSAAAVYYHADETCFLRLTIMMRCDASCEPFEFEALLVPVHIGNTHWRVGLRSPGRLEGPDPDLSLGSGRYGDR